MKAIDDFIQTFDISEEDALKALIGAFSPMQPSSLRQKWLQSTVYGNAAPTTQELWQLMVNSDFRCRQCGSQRRITIEHINGNATDHSFQNLEVLCSDCNRANNSRRTIDTNHQLRLYTAALDMFRETNKFPTDTEIRKRAGTAQVGGATYLLRYMRVRLENGARRSN